LRGGWWEKLASHWDRVFRTIPWEL
jgi:hypothetical protein